MRNKIGRFIIGHKCLFLHTKESSKKVSQTLMGHKVSEETRKKIKAALLGRHLSNETKLKIRNHHLLYGVSPPHYSEEKHWRWKGDSVGYIALHQWVYKHRGKADHCSYNSEHVGKYEWANVSGNYLRDVNDFVSLCKRCHVDYDMGKLRL